MTPTTPTIRRHREPRTWLRGIPPRLLLGEDDDDVRRGLEVLFEQQGYRVVSAATGDVLLDHLASSLLLEHRSEPPPDIVVADIRMPGFNGLSILEGLRDAGWTTPYFVITAFGDPAIRARTMALGATGYFDKPFDPLMLVDAVDRAL